MARKKGYGQFCPVAKAAEIVAERWTPLVLRELLAGTRRFNDLRRGVPLMSPSLLSRRLKELQLEGLVERRRNTDGKTWEYHLTEAGEALRPIIEGLGWWGRKWAQSNIGPEDMDPGLLMWDVSRCVRRDALPDRRTVVEFEIGDVPRNQRYWWLLVDGEDVDVCPKHPGDEVALTVAADVGTIVRVWLGEIPLRDAIRSGQIELSGSRQMVQAFPAWFTLSSFAHPA